MLTIKFRQRLLTFTKAQFAMLSHTDVTATDPHSQKEHRYSGIPLREVLSSAGAPLGEALKGPALRLVVVIRARDGYAAAFSLTEFDEAYTTRIILLADSEDGASLPENAKPLRLIVPGDKKAARWVRMVEKIEIRDMDENP